MSAFSGKQPRGSSFDRLVPDLPLADFMKHALSVAVHPMAQPCPLPSRLVNTIVSAAKLAEDLVAHRWKLFETVLKNHHELSAARKTWRASLSSDLLTLFGSCDFTLLSALVGRSWLRGQTLVATKSWCTGNLVGKVEVFVILTIAPKTGSTKHSSPKRHTNLPVSTTTFLLSSNGKLPWCQITRVCCRFVETFQANWHWFEPSRGFLVP